MSLQKDYQRKTQSKRNRRIILVPFLRDKLDSQDYTRVNKQLYEASSVPRQGNLFQSIDPLPTQVNTSVASFATERVLEAGHHAVLKQEGHDNGTSITLCASKSLNICYCELKKCLIPMKSALSELYDIPTMILPATPRDKQTQAQSAQASEGNGYVANLAKLLKSSGVYALSSLASPLIALVLAPFLTRNLSHIDYGVLAVLNTAIGLVSGITQLGLGSAFFRSYNYDYESPKDRLAVLSTTIILLAGISIPTTMIFIWAAPWLAALLFNSASFSSSVRLAGLIILVQNLSVPAFSWLRAENRALFFSLLSIANLLISLGATLVFVGVLHLSVFGAVLATGAGYAVVVICTLPIALYRSGTHLRLNIAKELLSFGMPNVSNFISAWVLQLSDRYLLGRLASLALTASYSLAYNLGGVLSVVVLSPFTLAWPSTMFSIAKREDASNIFRLVFRWFGFVLLFAAFGLSLICISVLNLLFSPAYRSAAPIIPIVAISTMFYGIYNIFMTGVSIKRKTWLAAAFTGLSAIVNVALNIILIPLWGSMGAAISTLLAYMLLAIIAYIVNQRMYPVPYEIGRFSFALFIGIVLYSSADILAQSHGLYLTWGIDICALGLYGGVLAILGMLPEWNIKQVSFRAKSNVAV